MWSPAAASIYWRLSWFRTNLTFEYRIFEVGDGGGRLSPSKSTSCPTRWCVRRAALPAWWLAATAISLATGRHEVGGRLVTRVSEKTVAVVEDGVGRHVVAHSDVTVRAFATVSSALIALLQRRHILVCLPRRGHAMGGTHRGGRPHPTAEVPVVELRRAVAVRVDAPELATVIHEAVAETVHSEA